jgi:hypothetical protein
MFGYGDWVTATCADALLLLPWMRTFPLLLDPVPLVNTTYTTVPLPVPDPPVVIDIQGTSGIAVQEQALSEGVMAALKNPPPASTACDVGTTANVQATPVCVTAKSALPPDHTTLMVPFRDEGDEFAATVKLITPGLKPDVAPVSVIHGVDVDALHEHPFGELRVAVKLNVPPLNGTLWLAGESA